MNKKREKFCKAKFHSLYYRKIGDIFYNKKEDLSNWDTKSSTENYCYSTLKYVIIIP